jgi:uncharacterized protein (UPF0261 family)
MPVSLVINPKEQEAVMTASAAVLIVATMDTKGQEAQYLKTCLQSEGLDTIILDAGIRGHSPAAVEITREAVAAAAGRSLAEVQAMGHEGEALGVMISGAVQCALELYRQGRVQGVIAPGGSMGTTLGTAVMRAFPLGFPKVMISTMASRDTRAFVETKDLFMLHAVSDLAGLNRITSKILHNGAMALAGMVKHPAPAKSADRPLAVLSTLGTTEACARQVRSHLEGQGWEVIVFHTVGAGGSAMEEVIAGQAVEAVIDLSLHEIADHLFGGDYDAGPSRGSVALDKGAATILVPGNIDFLVSGSLEKARRRFAGRPYHVHNSAITVFQTSPEEMATLGRVVAGLCTRASRPPALLVPTEGFSAFDHAQGPMPHPTGRRHFIAALRSALQDDSAVQLVPCHINDPQFGQAIMEAWEKMLPARLE